MKIWEASTHQPPALPGVLLLAVLAASLMAAAASQQVVRVPVVPSSSFKACTTEDKGEGAREDTISLKLPLFLAVNCGHSSQLSVQLYLQWISSPISITLNSKDRDESFLVVESSASSFEIPVHEKGWISIILLPNEENSLLLAIQNEREMDDSISTVRSVLIKDFSHIAPGQLVNVTSSRGPAVDVKCLQGIGDRSSTELFTQESTQKTGGYLPIYVVVPVVICMVFIVVIVVLSVLFLWQRCELKKRRDSYQQDILRKQEELERFNQPQREDVTPQVPPRVSYNSSKRISLQNDEESMQLHQTGAGSSSEVVDTVVHVKPRTYVNPKLKQQVPLQISNCSKTQDSKDVQNKRLDQILKIIRGRTKISTANDSHRPVERELSNMSERSRPDDKRNEEAPGGFNGPYWHHSLRQPPGGALKTYKV